MSEEVNQFNDTMDLRELRKKLNISPAVAYTLARANELPVPAIKVGGQYRFSRKAFNTLMEAQHGRVQQEDGSEAA